MSDVKVGDWVETDIGNVVQVGYITNIFPSEVEIRTVRIGKRGYKQIERKHRRVFYQNIDRLNDLTKSENMLRTLIDLALVKGEKQWFNSLSEEYKQMKEKVY